MISTPGEEQAYPAGASRWWEREVQIRRLRRSGDRLPGVVEFECREEIGPESVVEDTRFGLFFFLLVTHVGNGSAFGQRDDLSIYDHRTSEDSWKDEHVIFTDATKLQLHEPEREIKATIPFEERRDGCGSLAYSVTHNQKKEAPLAQ